MTDPAREILSYTIVPTDPSGHVFEVSIALERPDPAGQVFTMPTWIPGSYMIRDYARHVLSVEAISDGERIALEKLDKTTWRCAPVRGELVLRYQVYGWDLSVRGAHLDTTHAYFNGACVFLAAEGKEACPVRLEVLPPNGEVHGEWRLATAMRRISGDEFHFGTFEAANYDELIDHPFEIGEQMIGEFEVEDVPHVFALRGARRCDMNRLCRDIATVCAEHHRLLGTPEDLDRYVFLLTALSEGYGGLEHRWSSSLVCKRTDLPLAGQGEIGDAYRRFLGLVSHEYFHLWNVKRMKPAVFTPYDLRAESYTGLLWVFEGVTSYYDDLALVRSGLIDERSYLELLAQTITRVWRTPGRHCQSIEESSFDAWTKFYKQDENGPNSIVSYYAKGAVVALALDLRLRAETGGCNLDVVLRECWRRFGETGVGMPERGIESIAEELSGLELSDFFDRYVRGTEDPPLEALFAAVGIGFHLRAATGPEDDGGKPANGKSKRRPWLGGRLASDGAKTLLSVVLSDGPLQRAGAAADDELVALDGLKITSSNLAVLLQSYSPGETVDLHVFRQDQLLGFQLVLGEPPVDTCYLTLEDAGEGERRRRDDWLSA